MQTKLTTLNNGLKVLLADTGSFPSFTALLLVGAGSRYETAKNNGIAHFFEHMAFKGSSRYPTALELSTLLDSLGSEQNAFTSKDYTGYWIKSPLEHLETILDVLADMIQRPLLKEEEIEREKGVIVEEINMYEDTPQYKVADIFDTHVFKGNALAMEIAGSRKTVESFTQKTFQDYMQSLYMAGNAVLVISGGIELAKNEKAYEKLIQAKFGEWKMGTPHTFEKYEDTQKKAHSVYHYKKTEQAHLVLGYKTNGRKAASKYALTVLSNLLGGGMSSRLFYELRERRGLCYYVGSGMELFDEVGSYYTRAGVSIDEKKLDLAIALIREEEAKIASGKFDAKELLKVKNMIKGNIILGLENSHSSAVYFGKKILLDGGLLLPQEVIAKIEAVEKEEVVALAQEIFKPERETLAVIGPFKKVNKS